MLKNNKEILSVLFDLDGTLADTSQDMCDSLNRILGLRDLKRVDCINLKKYISRGAIGVIELTDINKTQLKWLRNEYIKRGVWARPLRNVVYFMPPFVIKKNQLDKIFQVTNDIFNLWQKKNI